MRRHMVKRLDLGLHPVHLKANPWSFTYWISISAERRENNHLLTIGLIINYW